MIDNVNTHWVFICGMSSDKEDHTRHVMDVFFALYVLKQKSISSNNISVLMDPIPDHILSTLLDPMPFDGIKVSPVSEFNNAIRSNDSENIALIILGHGGPEGIDAHNPLKPHDLINEIRLKQNLKHCIVIFGQCYSGIYNYTNLIKSEIKDKNQAAICFIGASGLNSSLSTSVNIKLNSKPVSWVANIFLCYFFIWIQNCEIRDIDGDGKETFIDAYKYAGANTSIYLLGNKADIALHLYPIQQELFAKRLSLETTPNDLNLQMAIDGLETKIKTYVSINHTIQDPWILNANKARDIVFKL